MIVDFKFLRYKPTYPQPIKWITWMWSKPFGWENSINTFLYQLLKKGILIELNGRKVWIKKMYVYHDFIMVDFWEGGYLRIANDPDEVKNVLERTKELNPDWDLSYSTIE